MATINLGRIKPVFRGAYDGATAYVIDDIVTFGASTVVETFICILASTGNATSDTTYWTKLAAKGGDVTQLTTHGDLIIRDASGVARLPAGTSGQVLQTQGTSGDPQWVDDGVETATTQGDILYRDGSGVVRLGAGSSGQVLVTGGAAANPSWGAGTFIDWEVKSASFTAVTGGAYMCDTTAGIFTLTLPDGPANNDHILINDSHGKFNTNNLTIARAANRENIAGSASDLIADTDYASFRLTYKFDSATSTNYGWILT
jgi:hypothetical protein